MSIKWSADGIPHPPWQDQTGRRKLSPKGLTATLEGRIATSKHTGRAAPRAQQLDNRHSGTPATFKPSWSK